MADGIAVGCPGPVPFTLVRELVDDIVTVSEESLSRALLLCLERAKLVVEPAGAAGVAALLDDPRAFEPPVVVVLSGGNIDVATLREIEKGQEQDIGGTLKRMQEEQKKKLINILDKIE